MESIDLVGLLRGGFGNLAAYLAAHVLLCLLPAFLIAGAMTVFIPKPAITRYLGRNAPKFVSYPAAALAGSMLAVCSCTIVPLFAGIYTMGAGLGPAITFLFFAPAANILALVYTGGVIGVDLAVARFILSLIFGIGIGLIMAMIFRRDDAAHFEAIDDAFGGDARFRPGARAFLVALVALLLTGTLKLPIFTVEYARLAVPIAGAVGLQDTLFRLVPFDAARGEEGVTVHGLILIALLAAVGLAAWRGVSRIQSGYNRATWVTMGLGALTLVSAAAGLEPLEGRVEVVVTGRSIAVALCVAVLAYIVRRHFSRDDLRDWLWESWRFVTQIFPLLVVGVFAVGVIRPLIQPEWIEALAGQNTVLGNLLAVGFGVFMYFPTLIEVPIAQMFLGLGMHRGPLLAYLMADPELSLQSILVVSMIIGRTKAWTYVAWVALFSVIAGLTYGSWVDGASIPSLAMRFLLGFAMIVGAFWLVGRRPSWRWRARVVEEPPA